MSNEKILDDLIEAIKSYSEELECAPTKESRRYVEEFIKGLEYATVLVRNITLDEKIIEVEKHLNKSDLSYNIVNNGSNPLREALDKLTTMEQIVLLQRHKIETIKFMLESRLTGSFRTKSFNCFIEELLEEIKYD